MPPLLDPVLLAGLVDDAAVFPPGSAPLPAAVAAHLARTAYRGFVGPLLVPAAAAAEVVELADGAPLRLGLIARPGMPVGPVRDGAGALAGTSVTLAGVEVGAASDWRGLLDLGAPVTVEIPRAGFLDALDEVADAARETAGKPLLQAKFRTGATETWAWPGEAELASFLVECVERELPFKLTGGLHHVVRGDHPGADGGPQHGLLNVLLAVRASATGASADEVAILLARRDADPLADEARAMAPDEAAAVRRAFRAYGCCTVTDPLGELADLGLIDPRTAGAPT